jgi:hypothetical protein
VYSREIEGQELTFGVSGKLIMNVLVMFDRETNSLWSQLLGEAIEGPFKGTRLDFVPAVHAKWSEWKEQHPDTKALVKGYPGSFTSYSRYYTNNTAGVLGETVNDERLRTKQLVVGVAINGDAVAYPFFAVGREETLINDEVGGEPILVVFDMDARSGFAFSRKTADGEILTFSVKEGMTFADQETGSIWDGWTGAAIDGELKDTQLERIKSTKSFWFGWKDFYPETRVYGEILENDE